MKTFDGRQFAKRCPKPTKNKTSETSCALLQTHTNAKNDFRSSTRHEVMVRVGLLHWHD